MFVSPSTIRDIVRVLTQHELSRDPHDVVAAHLVHSAGQLTAGSTVFASLYLFSHGLAKVVLVVAVLKDRLWAYPAMIGLLGLFIVYQLYRLGVHATVGLSLLTVFDAVVVWLTVHEYRRKRAALATA